MEYKHEYKNNEEREKIINDNTSLFLIEEQNITEGNFLIFADKPRVNMEIQDLNYRISDISEYIQLQDESTISDIENFILEIETNNVLNGGM